MSSVAEKARFYLERTVPQLREWEDRGIFTKEEIRTIVKRRNEFEHRVLSPRNQPGQYFAYATYERALADLLARRLQRLRIHNLPLSRAFSARPAFVLQRGVDRHPSSSQLWRAYLAECSAAPSRNSAKGPGRRRRTTKRWRTAMTRALRLLPTDAGLWAMAGHRAVADGDWEGARGMFMRGCRFCSGDGGEAVWLEFARCEMLWLERMGKKIKKPDSGIKKPLAAVATAEDGDGNEILFDDDEDDDDSEEDLQGARFILPEPGKKGDEAPIVPMPELEANASIPAMAGAIPQSIFDVSTRQRFFSPAVGRQFLVVFASFRSSLVPRTTTETLMQHVVDAVAKAYPGDPETVVCFVTQPVEGITVNTAAFVRGLREMLARLYGDSEGRKVTGGQEFVFRDKITGLVDGWLEGEMDDAVRTVLEDVKLKMRQTV